MREQFSLLDSSVPNWLDERIRPTSRLRVLDLFCGLGGWSSAFRERGHDVVGLDIEPYFAPTIVADVLTWNPEKVWMWRPDIILASPPCTAFTVMQIGRNWTHHPENAPKTASARLGLALLERTIELIAQMAPRWFVIENPVGKMRRMRQMAGFERRTVTYCRYGERRMKPTDLWSSRWPKSLHLEPPCRNGDACHTRAPRGSRTGTQGMTSAQAALVPRALSLAVCLACELDAMEAP